MKKYLWMVLIAVLLITAGCGQKQQDGGIAQNTEQQKQTVTPAVDAEKNNYFVDVNWLKENLNNVVLIDARKDKDYNDGHIPGAINAVWQVFADMEGKPGEAGWGTVLPKEKLAEKLGAVGIDGTKPVVIYTVFPGWGEDGRITWMLKMAGIQDVKMLDGGWTAWTASGNEVSKEAPAVTAVSCTVASFDENMNATLDWITANKNKIKIVDARSPKEYGGATDFGEARGGHLPGAISIPFETTLNSDGTVKSTAELKDLFTKAGLTPEDEIVTYCTKGIRSAHMSLLLRMAGFEKARNYDGSYYEWAGNPSLTVEK